MTPEKKEEVLFRQLGMLCDLIVEASAISELTGEPEKGMFQIDAFISEVQELRQLKTEQIEQLKNG